MSIDQALTERREPWDLEIDWHLTNRCNFDCKYCHPQIRTLLNTNDGVEPSPEEAERAFSRIPPALVHMSGGEPLLFPGFSEMCKRLSRRHWISVNTNLSVNDEIRRFVAEVPPSRVKRIAAALHTEESERNHRSLDDFASNVIRVQMAGFPISALYVLHPTLLARASVEIPHLRRVGIQTVEAKLFKGAFEGRRYPDAYSAAERSAIQELTNDYDFVDAYLADQLGSFKGHQCSAGRTSFKVGVTGDVRRCATVSKAYGNLFDGSFHPEITDEPCSARRVLVLSQCLRYSMRPEIGGL